MEKRKVTKQIPHACPVCKGKGEVGADQAQHEAQPKYDGTQVYACHVCSGSCLIWEIREEEEEVPLIMPQLQLPQPILNPNIPNLPNIGLPPQPFQPYTFGDPNDYKVTWTSASNRPPELGKLPDMQSFNSPAWKVLSYPGGNTCGCPKQGPHTIECMSTWNPRPNDPAKNGNNCACSPWGQPHSDNCKAWH